MPILRTTIKTCTTARSWAASSRMAAPITFIVRLCELIKHLAVDKLHIVGDLFRPRPPPRYHSGSAHAPPQCGYPVGQPRCGMDGAAAGSPICICTVLKTTLAYHNHGMLEDCYGINLRHLQRMAEQFYGDDDLSIWMPHTDAARGPYGRNAPPLRRDAQGHHHPDVQAGVPGHRPQPGFQDAGAGFPAPHRLGKGTVTVGGKRVPCGTPPSPR